MINKLEKHLRDLACAIKDVENTPKKYRDKAAKQYVKLSSDLDKIYLGYSKLHLREKKIAEKYGLFDL